MIVAFMGSDGSGKTKICSELGKKLKKIGYKINIKAEFDFFVLKYFLKLFPQKKLNQIRRNIIQGNIKEKSDSQTWREYFSKVYKGKSSTLYKIWLLFVLMDHYIEHI